MVSYPWISKTLLICQVVTTLEVNKEIDMLTDHQLEVRPFKSGNRTANGSFHGVFTRKEIKNDQRVFQSCGPLNVHARKQDKHCCNCGAAYTTDPKLHASSLHYCSTKCSQIAEKHYHSILAANDFKELFEDVETPKALDAELTPLSNLIWLRGLAMCVRNRGHSLKYLMMTRLLGQYKKSPPIL
jgi:hypothetical protein